MPEACHLLVSRLLGMPAAPLFAEDCNSNDICELFIGNQRRSCNPYKISYYFSSLTDIYFPRLPGFRILLILNIGSRQTHFFFFNSVFFLLFFFSPTVLCRNLSTSLCNFCWGLSSRHKKLKRVQKYTWVSEQLQDQAIRMFLGACSFTDWGHGRAHMESTQVYLFSQLQRWKHCVTATLTLRKELHLPCHS